MTDVRCTDDSCRYYDPYSGKCLKQKLYINGDGGVQTCESYEKEDEE